MFQNNRLVISTVFRIIVKILCFYWISSIFYGSIIIYKLIWLLFIQWLYSHSNFSIRIRIFFVYSKNKKKNFKNFALASICKICFQLISTFLHKPIISSKIHNNFCLSSVLLLRVFFIVIVIRLCDYSLKFNKKPIFLLTFYCDINLLAIIQIFMSTVFRIIV